MKFYIHCEDPEITTVIVWEKDKPGTILNALHIFCANLQKKYPNLDQGRTIAECYNVKNARGKTLAIDSNICSVVNHMDDLHVTWDISLLPASKTEKDNSKSLNKEKKKNDEKEIDSETKKKLEGQNNAALIHFNNERYRKAIQVYTEMLEIDDRNKKALIGLCVCYLHAGRPKKALQFAERGVKHHEDDRNLLLLLGKCCVATGDGDKAVEVLMKLCKLIRQTEGTKTEEKHEIQVHLAKAYMLKDQKDMAITILQGVLRENLEHMEALVEYAALLYPLGPTQSEEALTALLNVLARKQTDRRAKQVFALLCSQPDGLQILKNVAGNVLNDVPALIYLSICLKEFSAIKESLELIKIALTLDPENPSTALIYIHTLELFDRDREIFSYYKQYFDTCPNRGISQLTCAFVNRYFSSVFTDNCTTIPEEIESRKSQISKECDNFEIPARSYTDEELYFVALLCTLVKLLYIKGHLSVIPALLDMIRPFCEGKDLHQTIIRNEVAFFNCIEKVFVSYAQVPATLDSPHGSIYMVGDSHCIPAAWQTLSLKDEQFTIRPVLSTGTKIWHLRDESNFYPKVNFYSAISTIPDGASVIVCLGEIDCREAFLKCWEKARYYKIEDAMATVSQIYLKLLKILKEKHGWRVFIHPVLPVLDITRPIVMQFNRILATQLLTDPSLLWLNFVNELISQDESNFREDFKLDGTHIHPKYVDLLSQAINVHL